MAQFRCNGVIWAPVSSSPHQFPPAHTLLPAAASFLCERGHPVHVRHSDLGAYPGRAARPTGRGLLIFAGGCQIVARRCAQLWCEPAPSRSTSRRYPGGFPPGRSRSPNRRRAGGSTPRSAPPPAGVRTEHRVALHLLETRPIFLMLAATAEAARKSCGSACAACWRSPEPGGGTEAHRRGVISRAAQPRSL